MKAAVIRKLSLDHSTEELEKAAEALAEAEENILDVEGEDNGERLTHLMLAIRVRQRMDQGEEHRVAFREQLADVRELLAND